MQNNATILIAAAFTMIGFALGRVTAPPSAPPAPAMSPMPGMHHMEWVSEGGHGEDEVMVIVKSLEDEGFEGDTVFAIPGGEVKLVRNGAEMEVEVEMEASTEDGSDAEGSKEVVVRKQVIVVEADNR